MSEPRKGTEVRRAQLKTAASLRAQFNHEVAMKRIDYKLDVIEPAVEQVAIESITLGEIPEFSVEED